MIEPEEPSPGLVNVAFQVFGSASPGVGVIALRLVELKMLLIYVPAASRLVFRLALSPVKNPSES